MSTKSRKRVLFVTRPLQAPWDEASKNFAHDLVKNISGTDITILTYGHIDDVPKSITQKSIYTNAVNDFSLYQRIRLVLWLAINARKYDIIHLIFTPSTLNAKILKALFGKKLHVIQTIATIREDLYGSLGENVDTFKEIFFGDTLITYSQFAKNKLNAAGFSNVQHIYPGFDLVKYHPTEKSGELTKKWNIGARDFVVQYNGEYARLGATDLIVDAFLEIWSDPKNTHIKFLNGCRIKNTADSVKKSEVIERFREAGHIDKVIFSDTFTGNMNDLYNTADLIIYPVTNMKGKFDVPLAMIEPYACKKVVVASDLPVFSEFSKDDINVIIPSNSASAITDAVISIAKNSSSHVRRGEEAYNFAHRHFDITKIALQYKNLYEKISR